MENKIITVKHKFSTPVLTILVLICTFLIFSANAVGRPQIGYDLYWQALRGAAMASWMFLFASFWGQKYALSSLGFLLALNFGAQVRSVEGLPKEFFLLPVIALVLGYLLMRPVKSHLLFKLRKFCVWSLSFGAIAIGLKTLFDMFILSYAYDLEMPFKLVALLIAILALTAFARFNGTIKIIDRRILIIYTIGGSMLIRQLMFIESIA